MSRYIDWESVESWMYKQNQTIEQWSMIIAIENYVDSMPTADVVLVKHGHWGEPQRDGCITYDKNAYRQCSVCGNRQYLAMQMNYCPNCGASMDEVTE